MSETSTGSTKAQSYAPIAKIVKGKAGMATQAKWPISNDGFGLMEGSVNFTCSVDDAGKIPLKGDQHPHDERLKCWKVQTTTRKGGLLDIDASYVGIETGIRTEPQIQISVGSTTDPIDTHNEFVTKIGGKPSAALNGAIFVDAVSGEITKDDKKGVFQEFSLLTTVGTGPSAKQKKNVMAGVKSYYSPTITVKGVMYTRTALITNKIVGAIGKTTVSGEIGGIPLLPTWAIFTVARLMNNAGEEGYYQPRNWLVAGVNVEEYGKVYKISYDLTLGGVLGWNSFIYKSGEKD
jgi:hypothetical protein